MQTNHHEVIDVGNRAGKQLVALVTALARPLAAAVTTKN